MLVDLNKASLHGTIKRDVCKKRQKKRQSDVRSQLVAQEFASGERRDDLSLATPPLTVTRLLLAGLAGSCRREERAMKTMMLIDVKKTVSAQRHQRRRVHEAP